MEENECHYQRRIGVLAARAFLTSKEMQVGRSPHESPWKHAGGHSRSLGESPCLQTYPRGIHATFPSRPAIPLSCLKFQSQAQGSSKLWECRLESLKIKSRDSLFVRKIACAKQSNRGTHELCLNMLASLCISPCVSGNHTASSWEFCSLRTWGSSEHISSKF